MSDAPDSGSNGSPDDTRAGGFSNRATRRHRPIIASPDASRAGLVAPALYFARSDGEVREYILRFKTTHLGSSGDNHVVIDGARSSHAKIRLERDRIELLDLDTHETYLNDEQVREALIRPGDTLRLGQATLSVAMKVLAPDAIEEPLWNARAALGLDADPSDELAAPAAAGWSAAEVLARLKSYMDALDPEVGFEPFLDFAVSGLVGLVKAERAVCILFEEDGKNPIFSVERWALARDHEEDGEDSQASIDDDVMAEAVRGDHVVIRELAPDAENASRRQVFCVRVRWRVHTVGLLYWERAPDEDPSRVAAVAELCSIAARILAHPIRHLLGLGGA